MGGGASVGGTVAAATGACLQVQLLLVGEIRLQLLDRGGDLLLLGNHLTDHVCSRLLLIDSRGERRKRGLAQLAQSLREEVLQVTPLGLNL